MTLSAGSGRRIAAVFGVVVLMACGLPYVVAIGGLPDNASLAVAAGFDHRTAVLGIAAALGLSGLWAALRPPPTAAEPRAIGTRLGLDTAFVILAVAVIGIAALLLWNGDDTYNEIYYFSDRIALMDQGKIPYRDFLFNYGPVLIWTPWAIHHLLPDNWLLVYLITDAGFLLLALLLIRGLVRALPVPVPALGLVFVALALFWLPLTYASGLHYSGIRFVVPVVLAFAARRLRGAGLARLWLQPVASVLVSAAISFETGIVMAVFCVAVLLFLALAERRWPPLLALAALMATLAALIAVLPAWFTAPLTANFSGREFPLVPNIFLLFFLFSQTIAALVGLPPLLRAARDGRLALPAAELGVCFITVIGILLIPGAVGRADFVHMFAFSFGAVVVALCWAAKGGRRLQLLVYAGITIYLVIFNHWLFVAPVLADPAHGRLERPAPAVVAAITRDWPGAYDPFFAFGTAAGVDTGFYTGSNDVVGPFATGRKRAELRAARIYLIPAGLRRVPPERGNALLAFERTVFAYVVQWPFPVPFHPRGGTDALTALGNEAVANCERLARVGDVIVCRNREYR